MSIAEHQAEAETVLKGLVLPNSHVKKIRGRIDTMRTVARTNRERLETERAKGRNVKPAPNAFLPIIAPSGCGKSTSIEEYVKRFLPDVDPSGHRPLVHVTLSASATTKQLGSDILETFGDPSFEHGTAAALLRRANTYLDRARTEILVIDELQHLINTDTGRRTAWSVTETIKRMLIRGTAPMILIGTPEALPVLSNAQMRSRCQQPVFIDPFDYNDAEQAKEFGLYCASMDLELERRKIFPKLSGLHADETVRILYDVSGGNIGIACNAVVVAAKRAIEKGHDAIRRKDLSHMIRRWAMRLGYVDHDATEDGARIITPVKVPNLPAQARKK